MGRDESEVLPCDRFPQRYGPLLSGGWTRRGCQRPNVPTTASGDGDTALRPGARVPPVAPHTARPAPQASAPSAPRQESPQPTCAQHQDRLAAPLPDNRSVGTQAARPLVAGRGASWEQEYRDLEAAVLLRNYSPRTLEAEGCRMNDDSPGYPEATPRLPPGSGAALPQSGERPLATDHRPRTTEQSPNILQCSAEKASCAR